MRVLPRERPASVVALSGAALRGFRIPSWAYVVAPYVAVVGIGATWLIAVRDVDLEQMNDLGIVSILPPVALVALGLLTVSFCFTLRRPEPPAALLLVHIVALVVMVYGASALIEEVPRFAAAWRHMGVSESISRTENVDPLIDAYFNWPGFFIVSALFTELGGVGDLSKIVGWAPVFFNLLYLGPLVVVLRAARSGEWVVWLGAWFFYLTNWIGQDYFSPQAMAFLFYLVVLGIVLRWFQTELPEDPTDGSGRRRSSSEGFARSLWGRRSRPKYGQQLFELPRADLWRALWARCGRLWAAASRYDLSGLQTPPSPHVRAALIGVAILLSAAVVAGHQLTPFALLLAVTALVVAGRCSARRLPLVIAALIVAWLSFVAVTYLRGHVETLLDSFGQVENTVGANVGGRLSGSAEHELIVRMRLGFTGLLWLIALVGGVREFRRGRPRVAFAILAIAPLGLVGLQSYGGEVLLRAYLFGLPFVAYFVASLFAPDAGKAASWPRTAAVVVVSSALLAGLLFTRYGNERMDYFTASEVAAVARVYEVADPGALLFAASSSLPWKFRDYERFDYELLTDSAAWAVIDPNRPRAGQLASAAERHIARSRRDTYLIITRSQTAQLELLGYPPTLLQRLDQAVSRSGQFVLVYRNAEAKVWRVRQSRQAPAA